ncbi:hypothetical protein BGZ65_002914 [Modicella reniformis]|uniref:Uncharacterized protein n=1 Tax=Modicella reniformis TaxID=1440133 RepID=A0A9P6MI06_9FUNG|nr:hypothetical protein BGZ65_002914 [Modicella reniformis]
MTSLNVHVYFAFRAAETWKFEDFAETFQGPRSSDIWTGHLQRIASCDQAPQNVRDIATRLHQQQKEMEATAEIGHVPLKRISSTEGEREKAATRSSSKLSKNWFERGTLGWNNAKFFIFNALTDKVRRDNKDVWGEFSEWCSQFSLQNDFEEDLDEWLRPLYIWEHIKLADKLEDLYGTMRIKDVLNKNQIERHYVWSAYDLHKKLWRIYATADKAMEGWLITFVYGPLLCVFLEVSGIVLKMTEKKGAAEIPGKEYRHDGILHYKRFDLDLMVIEAKPSGYGCDEDFTKLGHALGMNLFNMQRRFPGMNIECLRTFGLMFSAYSCTLLEMRFVGRTAVMHYVGRAKIPREVDNSDELGSTLKMFVKFKRRIEETILHMNLANVLPTSKNKA